MAGMPNLTWGRQRTFRPGVLNISVDLFPLSAFAKRLVCAEAAGVDFTKRTISSAQQQSVFTDKDPELSLTIIQGRGPGHVFLNLFECLRNLIVEPKHVYTDQSSMHV